MALPQFKMSDLLAAGVHYGHRTFRWNPQLAPYIYGSRNGIHIIDLQQTVPMMYQALAVIQQTVSNNGRVLFVGTKRQAQQPVKEMAERSGMYFVNHRWLGGMLTNWKTINASIKRLKDLETAFEKDAKATAHYEELLKNHQEGDDLPVNLSPLAHLNKKERLMQKRDMDKLELVLGGIKNMGGLPDLVVVLDVKKDKIAVLEANCLNIPVIGIVDTNSSIEGVDYPIMGNDDAVRAINLYGQLFSDAALEGIAQQAKQVHTQTVTTAPKATASVKVADAKVTLSPKAQAAAEQAEAEAKAVDAVKATETKAVETAKPAETATA